MPTVKDKNTGKVISRQPYNNQGTKTASSIANSNPNWEASYDTNDARSRSQVNHAGDGMTGFSGIGSVPQYHQGGEVYGRPTKKEQKEKDAKTKAYKEKVVKAKGDFEKDKEAIKRRKSEACKELEGELKDYRSKVNAVRRDRSLSAGERTRQIRKLTKDNEAKGLISRDKRKQRRKDRRKARKDKKMKAIQAKVETNQAVWGAEKSKLENHEFKKGGKVESYNPYWRYHKTAKDRRLNENDNIFSDDSPKVQKKKLKKQGKI